MYCSSVHGRSLVYGEAKLFLIGNSSRRGHAVSQLSERISDPVSFYAFVSETLSEMHKNLEVGIHNFFLKTYKKAEKLCEVRDPCVKC